MPIVTPFTTRTHGAVPDVVTGPSGIAQSESVYAAWPALTHRTTSLSGVTLCEAMRPVCAEQTSCASSQNSVQRKAYHRMPPTHIRSLPRTGDASHRNEFAPRVRLFGLLAAHNTDRSRPDRLNRRQTRQLRPNTYGASSPRSYGMLHGSNLAWVRPPLTRCETTKPCR